MTRVLRKQLIETAQAMNASGLNQGTAGNLSVRCDEGMLITPSGMEYANLAVDDIVASAIDPREGEYLDALRRILSTEALSVGNIMSGVPVRLPATATLKEACETMAEHDVRRVLVDQGRELIGVVTAMDIIRHLAC